MANVTIAFGATLLVLGIVSYLGTNGVSKTALIPSGFGLVLLALGMVARDADKRKHAMHAAAAIGLLGFLGSASGIVKTTRLLAGETILRPQAAIAQATMAILCLVFVALCVRSFIHARRTREAEGRPLRG